MAEICDLVEAAVAGDSAIATSAIQPASLVVSTAVAGETLAHTVLLALDDALLGEASASESVGILLVSGGTIAAYALPSGSVRDLALSRAVASSRLLPIVLDHADDYAIGQSAYLAMPIGQLVTSQAVASSTVLPQATVGTLAVSAGRLADQALSARLMLLVSGMTGASATWAQVERIDLAVANAVASAVALQALQLHDLARSTGVVGSTTDDVLHAINLAISDAYAVDSVIGEPVGGAWTANTDTLAMSRYAHLPLHALASVGDRLLLAGHAGVYRRGGTDDDGVPIDGYVRTGLHRWGTNALFRVQQVYAGYTGGGLRVQVGETSTGQEITYSYDMPARSSTPTAPTHGRVKPGAGMRTMYARLTLRNIDGAPLRVVDADLTTFDTSRKT
jgi:hypothetical protein